MKTKKPNNHGLDWILEQDLQEPIASLITADRVHYSFLLRYIRDKRKAIKQRRKTEARQ